MRNLNVAICVLTLNAGNQWNDWLQKVKASTYPIKRFLVIDSSSGDQTVEQAQKFGFEILVIDKKEFGHGKTRQIAVEILSDMDVIIFFTQDAFLSADNSIHILLESFKDPSVGAAYGRQVPRLNAGAIEAHARIFNYPPESQVRSLEARKTLGIKAAFLSNSFSAYRVKALNAVGGFSTNVIFGEDMLLCARLLLGCWKVVYEAKATVAHSHNYGLAEEFRRCFDIGVLHSRESWLLSEFGSAGGEGLRYVKSETHYLLKRKPWLLFSAWCRVSLKLIGYRLGLVEKKIPLKLKVMLSMNKGYWRQE